MADHTQQVISGSFVASVPLNPSPTSTTVEIPRPIYYNMRGYDPSLGDYEFWETTDPGEANPSGNPLIDITQVSTFT